MPEAADGILQELFKRNFEDSPSISDDSRLEAAQSQSAEGRSKFKQNTFSDEGMNNTPEKQQQGSAAHQQHR